MRAQRVMAGFTLIELITVLILVGILAVTALPRMFDRNTFESRGFFDETTLVLGIRPENFRIATEGISLDVDVVEELGADGYVYGTLSGLGADEKLYEGHRVYGAYSLEGAAVNPLGGAEARRFMGPFA